MPGDVQTSGASGTDFRIGMFGHVFRWKVTAASCFVDTVSQKHLKETSNLVRGSTAVVSDYILEVSSRCSCSIVFFWFRIKKCITLFLISRLLLLLFHILTNNQLIRIVDLSIYCASLWCFLFDLQMHRMVSSPSDLKENEKKQKQKQKRIGFCCCAHWMYSLSSFCVQDFNEDNYKHLYLLLLLYVTSI